MCGDGQGAEGGRGGNNDKETNVVGGVVGNVGGDVGGVSGGWHEYGGGEYGGGVSV